MEVFLVIYLIIGVLSNIIGPLAIRSPNISRSSKKQKVKKRKDIFTMILLVTLTILFYPIMYLILMIDFFFVRRPRPWDDNLYYWRISGTGTILCLKCDFKENIISFLHGLDDWNRTGYQCQKCGKFHVVENDLHISEIKKCDCGGDLNREKPIFCPKCKTKKLTYKLMYIT